MRAQRLRVPRQEVRAHGITPRVEHGLPRRIFERAPKLGRHGRHLEGGERAGAATTRMPSAIRRSR